MTQKMPAFMDYQKSDFLSNKSSHQRRNGGQNYYSIRFVKVTWCL
jgi:hypothetical protein